MVSKGRRRGDYKGGGRLTGALMGWIEGDLFPSRVLRSVKLVTRRDTEVAAEKVSQEWAGEDSLVI